MSQCRISSDISYININAIRLKFGSIFFPGGSNCTFNECNNLASSEFGDTRCAKRIGEKWEVAAEHALMVASLSAGLQYSPTRSWNRLVDKAKSGSFEVAPLICRARAHGLVALGRTAALPHQKTGTESEKSSPTTKNYPMFEMLWRVIRKKAILLENTCRFFVADDY